ncbi:MAG: hypothetical protein ABSB65_09730 [Candidatus Acidiferrales bacterium]|jgi:hypothetical protein
MLTPDSSLTISEFSDLFGFPAEAVILAVENQRSKLRKPLYTYRDLASRWGVSIGSVYNILRAHGATVVDLLPGKGRGKKVVKAATVERIEKAREIDLAA